LTVDAIREGIVNARRAGATQKPILACVMADPGRPQPLDAGSERIPAYAFPENAVRALAKIADYAEWRAQPPGLLWGFEDVLPEDARDICRGAVEARGETWLTDEENAARAERVRSAVECRRDRSHG
jgi:acyl-CoA synthetase (NDP forming)